MLPGVNVGPLDPDRTAEFGQIGQRNSARQLVRVHTQSYPPILTRALAKKQDVQRSLGLNLDEVRAYLDGLTLPNGDPAMPVGCTLVGASVKGERDQEQVLTYTFRVIESGRTAKWFAPYSATHLPVSFAEGNERARIHELSERGIVTLDESTGTDASLAKENAELRKQLAELSESDVEPERSIDEVLDADALKTLAADQAERIEELEAELAERVEQERIAAEAEEKAESEKVDEHAVQRAPAAGEDEPFEGYDAMRAPDVVKAVKTSDSLEYVQGVLDYELKHANRRGVVGACEVKLGTGGAA